MFVIDPKHPNEMIEGDTPMLLKLRRHAIDQGAALKGSRSGEDAKRLGGRRRRTRADGPEHAPMPRPMPAWPTPKSARDNECDEMGVSVTAGNKVGPLDQALSRSDRRYPQARPLMKRS
jgi:hypothetical protein